MNAKLVWGLGGLLLLILLLLPFFTHPPLPEREPLFPWRILATPSGGSRVFDIELGVSTLDQARRSLKNDGEVSLFLSSSGIPAVEAYFDRLDLDGLKANLVLSLAVPEAEARAMYEAGARVSTSSGGDKRVSLTQTDLQRIATAYPISGITYLPGLDLSPDMIEHRFGAPARRVREPGSAAEHWLYPQQGLDITLNEKGKEILQYVHPKDFEVLLRPLLARGGY